MIRDARVLQPEFVPREVQHRDAEVNQLTNALDPIVDGERGDTAFLFGPSGVGKTCIAQYTVEQLREAVVDIEYQYVNCWQNYSRFRALYRILEGLNQTIDVHRRSTPHDELLARLREYEGPPYVVVLDEVDQLQDSAVLYDLYRVPNLSMILVANREEELFVDLDDRVVSRLQSARRIRFDHYGEDELVAIMRDRVDWGLEPGAVTDDLLRRIADAAAGDARVALGILRNAARDATRAGADSIEDTVVDDAIPDTRQEIHQKTVETLTPHQRTLYDVLDEFGRQQAGELYARYEERVDDPMTRRTVRNYLQKMIQYDLVASEGENRARTYRLTR
ncbi:Cdc6/Cdc18 family protein [Halomarina salina]|uniref:Cdc6/Cdc18 family protein n=1 Tax=Halomarina salina TaxID=1872699 RepID=A0ABD5RP06_9EURY|nr:Cdc6/Cdc18 family protein [Halomarina salina]